MRSFQIKLLFWGKALLRCNTIQDWKVCMRGKPLQVQDIPLMYTYCSPSRTKKLSFVPLQQYQVNIPNQHLSS